MPSNLELTNNLGTVPQTVNDETGTASALSLSVDTVAVGLGSRTPCTLVLGTSGTELLRGDDPGTKAPSGPANSGLLIQSAQTVEVNIDANDQPSDMFAITHGSRRVELFRVQEDGRVGVGTSSPDGRLHVNDGSVRITNRGAGAVLLVLDSERGWVFRQHGSGAGTALELTAANPDNNNKNFIINTDGRVGIGTQTPLEKLDVNGSVRVSDDIILVGSDCAEDFDVDDEMEVEPGRVMVLCEGRRLRQCTTSYDPRVAGVVSGAGHNRPGIVLGRRRTDRARVPVALNGTVYCRVDAGYGEVRIGDLLTTSETTGHAMRADDRARAFGSVLGKAMSDLRSGIGMVPVLISLQ